MNNKELGTSFETDFVELLNRNSFWAHFIVPGKSGKQPFDVIAIKYGKAFVFDCKTCSKNSISYSRLEDNQIFAMEKAIRCGCEHAYIAVLHNDNVYIIRYEELKELRSVKLDESNLFEQVIH